MKDKIKKMTPFILMILDGWGIAPPSRGNAVTLAKTPVMNSLYKNYPHTLLCASGRCAGLPPHQDGNSEAGHMNIGAGCIVEQDSVRISKSINEGTFFKNAAFLEAIEHVQKLHSNMHLIGLLTAEQSAHADPDHLLALLSLLRGKGVKRVFFHLFTDGRDSPKYISIKLLENLKKILLNHEKVTTICGRYYAMDRVKEWSRTKKAYEAIVLGEGFRAATPESAVLKGYNRGEDDEYLSPTIITGKAKAQGMVSNGDAIIFFNLRSDRVRQLTKAFVQDNKTFIGFKRKKILTNLRFVTLTEFGPDLPGVLSAYPSQIIKNTYPFVLRNYRQLYIAESEKFAHVTYFFNGGYANPVAGEERIMIKSPIVSSYALRPKMSAARVNDIILEALRKNKYDVIVVNYANPDMVGHTGNLKAGIKAVEFIDQCVGKIIRFLLQKNGLAFITADHGNIEEMIDLKTGEINTTHSTNPVPFIMIKKGIKKIKLRKGKLADIAPTIIDLLNLEKPKEMKGKTLCR